MGDDANDLRKWFLSGEDLSTDTGEWALAVMDAFRSFFLSCLAIFSNSSFLRGVFGLDMAGDADGVREGEASDDSLSLLSSDLLSSGDEKTLVLSVSVMDVAEWRERALDLSQDEFFGTRINLAQLGNYQK